MTVSTIAFGTTTPMAGARVAPSRRSPLVVAVLGPTASGKSALGLAIAERFGGEVIACDSTTVYRGFDIGTDKPTVEMRRGIPHHLIDLVEPTETYTAAHFARDASRLIVDMHRRGVLPVLVGGTGFYYRALTRGLFPGPGANEPMRIRLRKSAERRGTRWLHKILNRIDVASAARIMPNDEQRLVRALEVYFTTGETLTAHFARTTSLIAHCDIVPLALQVTSRLIAERVARRVDEQFARGVVEEVEALLARGVPPESRSLGGLVYRQIMEMRRGVRGEEATRALIAQENRRYARRQLIWFRKEPNLVWLDGPGESAETLQRADALLASRGVPRRGEAS